MLDAESLVCRTGVDPLKLVVDVTGLGVSGWQVDEELRRIGAPAEGADAERVFLVVPAVAPHGVGVPDHHDGFVDALRLVAGRSSGHRVPHPRGGGSWRAAMRPGEQVLTPGEARWSPVSRVSLSAAVGGVAAEPLVPYPPGVPAVVPGERIERHAVVALRQGLAAGGHVHGCADPSLRTVAVVAGS